MVDSRSYFNGLTLRQARAVLERSRLEGNQLRDAAEAVRCGSWREQEFVRAHCAAWALFHRRIRGRVMVLEALVGDHPLTALTWRAGGKLPARPARGLLHGAARRRFFKTAKRQQSLAMARLMYQLARMGHEGLRPGRAVRKRLPSGAKRSPIEQL